MMTFGMTGPAQAAPTGGANGDCGAYCPTNVGAPSTATGNATSQPGAGTVGNADSKNPPGQFPDGSDSNNGYECDGNSGIGKTNPAHTGCDTRLRRLRLLTLHDAPPPGEPWPGGGSAPPSTARRIGLADVGTHWNPRCTSEPAATAATHPAGALTWRFASTTPGGRERCSPGRPARLAGGPTAAGTPPPGRRSSPRSMRTTCDPTPWTVHTGEKASGGVSRRPQQLSASGLDRLPAGTADRALDLHGPRRQF